MDMDLSIIICTLNRKDHLIRALESLEALHVSAAPGYEILVIDNGSSDGTSDLIRDFVKKDDRIWKYYYEPEKGLSNARNCGVKNAQGEIIAFTDDDVIVAKNWLQALWETFKNKPDVIGVQGKILLQRDIEQMPIWADPDDLLFCTLYDPSPEAQYTDTLVGANMAFRREAFEKYGLFDPRLGAGASGFCEDTEFAMRLRAAGERLFYEPSVVIFHEHDEKRLTWEYWCERTRRYARSKAIVDVMINGQQPSALKNRRKLVRYWMKYFLSSLTNDEKKKYKYNRKIRQLKYYLKAANELRRESPMRCRATSHDPPVREEE